MIERTKIVRMVFGIDENTNQTYTKEELVKPLSDEEIEIMASAFIERATSTQRQECIEFARAIEERHEIK